MQGLEIQPLNTITLRMFRTFFNRRSWNTFGSKRKSEATSNIRFTWGCIMTSYLDTVSHKFEHQSCATDRCKCLRIFRNGCWSCCRTHSVSNSSVHTAARWSPKQRSSEECGAGQSLSIVIHTYRTDFHCSKLYVTGMTLCLHYNRVCLRWTRARLELHRYHSFPPRIGGESLERSRQTSLTLSRNNSTISIYVHSTLFPRRVGEIYTKLKLH